MLPAQTQEQKSRWAQGAADEEETAWTCPSGHGCSSFAVPQKCSRTHSLTDCVDLLLDSTQQLSSLFSLLMLQITLQPKEGD